MREMSLAGFIGHMTGAIVALERCEHHAMEQAAQVVEVRAKAIIGHYQTDTGIFPPWAQLADSTMADRARLGFPENEPLLRTGEMRDSIEHVAERHEAAIGSNLDIAEYQELGTSRIPPRSFLGVAAHQTGERVAEIVGSGVFRALVGDAVVDRFLLIPHSSE